MPDHIYALPQGHRVEAYELQRLLSVDRYGLKYFGYDHNENRQVAIKEYLPDSLAVRQDDSAVVPRGSAAKADFDAGLTRFLDGARAQSRIDHPGMAKVHSWLQANGTGYIVMEYVEGETLSARLKKRGTLPKEELGQVVPAVLGALEQLHDIDVLHQDITPGNIVFRADGAPLLLESGVGRYSRGTARQAFADRSGGFESVPPEHGYAALEQYSSRRRLGPWTDIYAFAAVLYRCVTGQTPPPAPDWSSKTIWSQPRPPPKAPTTRSCWRPSTPAWPFQLGSDPPASPLGAPSCRAPPRTYRRKAAVPVIWREAPLGWPPAASPGPPARRARRTPPLPAPPSPAAVPSPG